MARDTRRGFRCHGPLVGWIGTPECPIKLVVVHASPTTFNNVCHLLMSGRPENVASETKQISRKELARLITYAWHHDVIGSAVEHKVATSARQRAVLGFEDLCGGQPRDTSLPEPPRFL
ncbi:hypothetical protein ARTHRO9V_190131 [Arthrobacter sp. 9V]|nr:hypothetical protein ARTHRO9V_190131 [Arthrobacter sp. 9V]